MKRVILVAILGLVLLLVGCVGDGEEDGNVTENSEAAEPGVEWHSHFFSAIGDNFYYEGTVHNGGRGTAKNVEVELLFPEDLVQRKNSEENPIELGEIGPEGIATYDGRIDFDFAGMTKPEILEQLENMEIKIRWTEDGTRNEDYLRKKEDIQQKQAS